MKLATLSILLILTAPSILAAEATSDADIAARAARVEILRARLATANSPPGSMTLIEADDLLNQLRAAPPTKRDALRTQLDAALSRAELEIETSRPKP